LKDLSDETVRYFKKLPGYDTLRLVLAEKVILVEGPTEELVIQRAYLDKKSRLPSSDGIDIITVNSLAFKR
jgi:predicted ATP-dependent endonuclease of OLD family